MELTSEEKDQVSSPPDSPIPVLKNDHLNSSVIKDNEKKDLEFKSRYEDEFYHERLIGKGGFGKVTFLLNRFGKPN